MSKVRYVLYEEKNGVANTYYYDFDEFGQALKDFEYGVETYDLYNNLEIILFRQENEDRKIIKQIKIEYKENDE